MLLSAVDILPSELPVESSNHFSELLMDLVEPLATSDGTLPFDERAPARSLLGRALQRPTLEMSTFVSWKLWAFFSQRKMSPIFRGCF